MLGVGGVTTTNVITALTGGVPVFNVVGRVSAHNGIVGYTFTISTTFTLNSRLNFTTTGVGTVVFPVVINGLVNNMATVNITVVLIPGRSTATAGARTRTRS